RAVPRADTKPCSTETPPNVSSIFCCHPGHAPAQSRRTTARNEADRAAGRDNCRTDGASPTRQGRQAGQRHPCRSDRTIIVSRAAVARYPGALTHPGCGRRVLRCRQAGLTAAWHRRRARLAAVTAKVAAGAVEPDEQCHSL